MIGARITPEQMEHYRERIRLANDPAEIAERERRAAMTADEDKEKIGAALLSMVQYDGRCQPVNGREEMNQNGHQNV